MWVVLDPEVDVVLARFEVYAEAREWIKHELAQAIDPDHIKILKRARIAPFDPEKDAK